MLWLYSNDNAQVGIDTNNNPFYFDIGRVGIPLVQVLLDIKATFVINYLFEIYTEFDTCMQIFICLYLQPSVCAIFTLLFHTWCDQAKSVVTRKYWLWVTAKQRKQYSLFIIVFATIQLLISLELIVWF